MNKGTVKKAAFVLGFEKAAIKLETIERAVNNRVFRSTPKELHHLIEPMVQNAGTAYRYKDFADSARRMVSRVQEIFPNKTKGIVKKRMLH
jgi:hypothetical protein